MVERQHLVNGPIRSWNNRQGWEVLGPVQKLWAGSRDEPTLAMGCDANSSVVVRAVLRVARSMERRLLAGRVARALLFSGAMERLNDVGVPEFHRQGVLQALQVVLRAPCPLLWATAALAPAVICRFRRVPWPRRS